MSAGPRQSSNLVYWMISAGLQPVEHGGYIGARPVIPYRVRDLLADEVAANGWSASLAQRYPRHNLECVVERADP